MKKSVHSPYSIHFFDILSALVLVVGLFYRFYILDFPYQTEDSHLDYIVAQHIVRYGEIPLSGSGNPLLIDSPLYYYIVAFFVWIHDSLIFLGVVNIFIQAISISIIYVLARLLFDRSVAFTAVLFAVVSYEYVAEAQYFFQTHVMQPFVLASYLFLALAYKKKTFTYILASSVSMIIALTIHHSVLAILPLYGYVVFLVMRADRYGKKQAITLVVVSAVSWLVLHVTVITLLTQLPGRLLEVSTSLREGAVGSIGDFIQRFIRNIHLFWLLFSDRGNSTGGASAIACILLGFSVVRYIFFSSEEKRKKWLVILCLFAIIQIVFIASFLRVGVWGFTFSSVFGLFFILAAACSLQWFSGGYVKKIFGCLMVILIMYVFSSAFALRYVPSKEHTHANFVRDSTEAIVRAVYDIEKSQKRRDLSFFRIQRVYKEPTSGIYAPVYTKQGIQIIEDLLYWPMLEKEFNRKFVRVDRNGSFPALLNEDEYVFVICDSQRGSFDNQDDCLNRYFLDNPSYGFERNVYMSSRSFIVLVHRLEPSGAHLQ